MDFYLAFCAAELQFGSKTCLNFKLAATHRRTGVRRHFAVLVFLSQPEMPNSI